MVERSGNTILNFVMKNGYIEMLLTSSFLNRNRGVKDVGEGADWKSRFDYNGHYSTISRDSEITIMEASVF